MALTKPWGGSLGTLTAGLQKRCYRKRGCGAVGKDAPPLYHRPRRSFLNGAATVIERTSARAAVGRATAFLRVNWVGTACCTGGGGIGSGSGSSAGTVGGIGGGTNGTGSGGGIGTPLACAASTCSRWRRSFLCRVNSAMRHLALKRSASSTVEPATGSPSGPILSRWRKTA